MWKQKESSGASIRLAKSFLIRFQSQKRKSNLTAAPCSAEKTLIARTVWGEPLSIDVGDRPLKANIHLPPSSFGPPPYPGVILVHGLTGDRNEAFGLFIKTAAELSLAGMIALRFDCRGAGETGGATEDITLTSLTEDLLAALAQLRAHALVDASKLGLLGLSLGGLVAACVASAHSGISTLCLWEAPFHLTATMNRVVGPFTVKSARAKGSVQAGPIRLGQAFFEEAAAIDATKLAKNYPGTVLLVQGTADSVVLPETAFLWQNAFAPGQAEAFLIEGANHAFTQDQWSWSAISKSVDWFSDMFRR